MSLFGSMTFLPLYLQVVKSSTPTEVGSVVTADGRTHADFGLLATSTHQQIGRYRIFSPFLARW